MRDRDFEFWLEHTYKTPQGRLMQKNSRQDRISNCRNVEEYEGDLDEHYRKDQMASLLKRLTYSRSEEERGIPPRHRVPFDPTAVKWTGTATLKSAVNLYRKFCASA
jgi:hypothetical protein